MSEKHGHEPHGHAESSGKEGGGYIKGVAETVKKLFDFEGIVTDHNSAIDKQTTALAEGGTQVISGLTDTLPFKESNSNNSNKGHSHGH